MLSGFLSCLNVDAFTKAALEVPYQLVGSDLFPGIELWVRRDDLLDPLISGNKAYKLLYNLLELEARQLGTVVTCGGAWSNHVHAVAAAGARFGFDAVGVIRGERAHRLSATLQDAERFGMKLIFVSREQYRRRGEASFISEIGVDEESALFVPEGGSNYIGVRGARVLGEIILRSAPVGFDQVWTACGTGATFAGLASGLKGISTVGVEVLKAGNSILRDAATWLPQEGEIARLDATHKILTDEAGGIHHRLLSGYHCGGYAKYPEELRRFQDELEVETGIPLDPVYTAKLLFALSNSAKNSRLRKGSKILAIHSGGLQGRRGIA
ncbi:pyridoxal-phosphate dependent enzyme [Microbulbifer sp. VAAF005]|uniref:1-aminocyclopropane-1-carboxylate deaminase/D-cysteine desulfhydrase n=1 Tax=Microbulbifer sp. VAAF005 TaxID=3034230 RepID=UPI0024ACE372|nr:pyridoxal-phosphate dependent enzyme [Microbulbifer sp. VAAF005]WHI46636.1 pyridoxal-phosphate dependent enzyme [Microbulbifer sp. VAAF005]